MFMEDAAARVFSLQQLRKLAVAGVNDLGSLKSETKPLSQAAASKQRQKLQTRALQKTAPPPVASSKPSTMAPKPLDISMPKLAAVQKLQLLLTKASGWEVDYDSPELRALKFKPTAEETTSQQRRLKDTIPAEFYHLPAHEGGPGTPLFTNDRVYVDVNGQRYPVPLRFATIGQEMSMPGDTSQLGLKLPKEVMLQKLRELAVHTGRGHKKQIGNLKLLPKEANVVQPPNNYRLLPTAPNITTTTPIQRAQNLHADNLPGSSAIKSTIQDNGPISTVGNVNGNAGQGVRAGGMKLAVDKLAKLLTGGK